MFALGYLLKNKNKNIVMIESAAGMKLIYFDKERKAKKYFKKTIALRLETITLVTIKKGAMYITTRPQAPIERINVNISNFWEDKIKERGMQWNT